MQILLSHTDGRPIYEQICAQIKSQILDGTLESGEQLPSIRTLAKELRISVITTKRAYDDLERDGFVQSVPGKGSFVAHANRDTLRNERLQTAEKHLGDAVAIAKSAGIELEELQHSLGQIWNGGSK